MRRGAVGYEGIAIRDNRQLLIPCLCDLARSSYDHALPRRLETPDITFLSCRKVPIGVLSCGRPIAMARWQSSLDRELTRYDSREVTPQEIDYDLPRRCYHNFSTISAFHSLSWR